MSEEDKVKKEIIQRFGESYKAFGLTKLMGSIVALLIFSPVPLSLDEISKQLGRSKGPISQVVRRLSDRNLIHKVWLPENNRKDYYEIQPEIFENAFRNNFELIKGNTRIAKYIKNQVEKSNSKSLTTLKNRIKEMEMFYELMEEHYHKFLIEWVEKRAKYFG